MCMLENDGTVKKLQLQQCSAMKVPICIACKFHNKLPHYPKGWFGEKTASSSQFGLFSGQPLCMNGRSHD